MTKKLPDTKAAPPRSDADIVHDIVSSLGSLQNYVKNPAELLSVKQPTKAAFLTSLEHTLTCARNMYRDADIK